MRILHLCNYFNYFLSYNLLFLCYSTCLAITDQHYFLTMLIPHGLIITVLFYLLDLVFTWISYLFYYNSLKCFSDQQIDLYLYIFLDITIITILNYYNSNSSHEFFSAIIPFKLKKGGSTSFIRKEVETCFSFLVEKQKHDPMTFGVIVHRTLMLMLRQFGLQNGS